jgi:tRNA-splicing ligase RtcB (3'-phosphate/5'-hydroxy nucleic acid ligase)
LLIQMVLLGNESGGGMTTQQLHVEPLPYQVWGRQHIDGESMKQMNLAMRLPISVAGALMPDAHVGYGLPIGGVLATENAVIPYAVGVDIACRMRLSVFPEAPSILKAQVGKLQKAITEQTLFGAGKAWKGNQRADHEVLDDPAWEQTRLLQSLKDTAYGQLGTSGSGNHFVEWGVLTLEKDDAQLGLSAGEYLAVLSHSGSRGVGYKIADHYSKLAMKLHPGLEKPARHLAWLDLKSEEGQEYWLSMQLAGRFAAANHYVIHDRVADAAGLKPIVVVENHHNFAWKERIPSPRGYQEPEREVIVHRKGATPAGKGVLGMIPGSMGDAGYVVRGLGKVESINSAAHGAGRQLSRRAARDSITKTERDRYLKERGVILIGGDLDEAPQAYKRIDEIMAAQEDLVEVVARFEPRIVRMDGKSK